MSTSTSTSTSSSTTTTPPRIEDTLFTYIEDTQFQSGPSFGRLLDAGTGSHSLRWIAGLIHHTKDEKNAEKDAPLCISSYTAITADEQMRKTVMKEAHRLQIEDKGDILIGNWATPKSPSAEDISVQSPHHLIDGQMYDTILADYLIGAMDGFSPYFQDQILPRLCQHLNPGGYLYIVGLEPIPDNVKSTDDPNAKIITEVRKVRDACILLAGHRCYREYPLTWVVRQIEKSGLLQLVDTKKFPIMYSHETISRQIKVGRSKLTHFQNEQLKLGMAQVLDDLEERSKQATEKSRNGRIKFGFDYVICAKRVDST